MKLLKTILSGSLGWAITAGAAISVGPSGSGVVTFDAWPSASEWSTLRIVGGNSSVTNAQALDELVQTNNAAGITNQLATDALFPGTAKPTAQWDSRQARVQTRPTGVAVVLLMASLRNDTGTNAPWLNLFYDYGVVAPLPEQVSGQRIYFSLTGEPGTWQFAHWLTSAGHVSFTLDLGTWPNGSPLYVLWADDNASSEPDTAYTIDNFVATSVPSLSIVRAGGAQLEIFWPATPGWVLQSTATPDFSMWETVTNAAVLSSNVWHVTVDTARGIGMFRLEKP